METVQITFTGKDLMAVASQAINFYQAVAEQKTIAIPTPAPISKKAKKAAAPVVAEEIETEELLDTSSETEETDFLTETEEPAAKSAKAPKAAKLTDKDVNTACMAHAKANGRPATMAILEKKFKVKSILELKPETYAAVISALKV